MSEGGRIITFFTFFTLYGIRTLGFTDLLLRITDSTDLATTLQAFYTTGYTSHCIEILHFISIYIANSAPVRRFSRPMAELANQKLGKWSKLPPPSCTTLKKSLSGQSFRSISHLHTAATATFIQLLQPPTAATATYIQL